MVYRKKIVLSAGIMVCVPYVYTKVVKIVRKSVTGCLYAVHAALFLAPGAMAIGLETYPMKSLYSCGVMLTVFLKNRVKLAAVP